MSKIITVSDSIYNRLSKHAQGFDTPARVIERFLNHYDKNSSKINNSKSFEDQISTLPKRGRKGYEQIPHYIIPMIRLMKKGNSYSEACKMQAEKLGVTISTVNAQCTRTLNLNAKQFIEGVKSGRILDFLYGQYHDQRDYIKRELGNLY